MGRKSTISRLPEEVKSYITGKLAEGRLTLDELIADLHTRYPTQQQVGELPSRAAVHRYGQKLERSLFAIKASTEAAKIIRSQAGDDEDARSEALMALVQTELFEIIMQLQGATNDDGDVDMPERLALLADVGKKVASMTNSSVNLKQFQGKVRDATRAAASAVEKTVKKAGLSDETVAEIKARILGIVDSGAKP